MKNLFKKKFATRVKHFYEDYFIVQYSEYRLIPIWYSLKKWFEYTIPNDLTGWSSKLYKRKTAERVAQEINSLEDVAEYYKSDKIKAERYYIREKKYYNSLDTKTKVYKK